MCLDKVDVKPTRKRGIGYKVLNLVNGEYLCWDYGEGKGKVSYPINKWVEDTSKGNISSYFSGKKYPKGFHVCLNPVRYNEIRHCDGDGRDIRLCKCKFRNVVATGSNQGVYSSQVVARQVMNLGEVEGWKV